MHAVVGFDEAEAAARRLAGLLGLPYRPVALHRFPDGESLVRVAAPGPRIVLYRSLDRPNEKLVEVLLAASALRDGGVREIILVAPYLAYMRQDIAFHPGEAVSQRVIGRLLAGAVDRVVTVNPHLHRTTDIGEVFPGIAASAIDATPAFAALLRAEGVARDAIVLGPDEESQPWATALADALGVDAATARKVRAGDRSVSIELPHGLDLAGRQILLLDDIVSSGTTLVRCAEACRSRGAARIVALVVHALYDAPVARRLAAAGVSRVISSDSVPHPSNGVTLAPLIAGALMESAGARP